MTSNMYDRAAAVQFIDTYAPINFGELYRIGLANKQAVDDARDRFGAQLEKWGQFQSPSAVDTKSYYDLTTNRSDVKDLVNQITLNPNALKDQAFRSRLATAVTNTDYAALSMLKQSSDNLKQRQTAVQRLMMEGKYNPLWDTVDIQSWDTLNPTKGIMTELTPDAYKSITDLVKPYVDNLEDSFIKTDKGWVVSGVTTNRTDEAVKRNESSIHATPEYQNHIRAYMRRGMSEADAKKQVDAEIIRAGREFAREKRERDPWWMKQAEYALKRAADKEDAKQQAIETLTGRLKADAGYHALTQYGGVEPKDAAVMVTTPGVYDKVKDALHNEEAKALKYVYKQSGGLQRGIKNIDVVSSIPQKLSYDVNVKLNSEGAIAEVGKGAYKKWSKDLVLRDALLYGAASGINPHSIPSPDLFSAAEIAKEKGINDPYAIFQPGPERDAFKHKVGSKVKFNKLWNNGDLQVVTVGGGGINTLYGDMYHKQVAYIPVEELLSRGIFEDELPRIGKLVRDEDVKRTIGITYDLTGDEKEEQKSNVSQSSKTKKWLAVEVSQLIDETGEVATTRNRDYNNDFKMGTEQNLNQAVRSDKNYATPGQWLQSK